MAGLGIRFDERGAHAADVHVVTFAAGLEKDASGGEAGK
jgi:hypothetical protein